MVRTVCAVMASILIWSGGVATAQQPTVLRVASVAFVPVKWDKESNLRRMTELAHWAVKQNPDLIVFPEGILEGYVIDEVREVEDENRGSIRHQFLGLGEPIDGLFVQRLCGLAAELKTTIIFGTLLREMESNTLFNSALVLSPEGEVIGRYDKRRTIHEGWADEFYRRGDTFPTFDIGKARIGIMICYDRHFQEIPDGLVQNGAEVIINPSYGSHNKKNDKEMMERAKKSGVPILFCHPKQNLFIDAEGQIIADDHNKPDGTITVVDMPFVKRQ